MLWFGRVIVITYKVLVMIDQASVKTGISRRYGRVWSRIVGLSEQCPKFSFSLQIYLFQIYLCGVGLRAYLARRVERKYSDGLWLCTEVYATHSVISLLHPAVWVGKVSF